MKKYLTGLLALFPLLLAAGAHAGVEDVLRAKIRAALPEIEITTITPVPVAGFPGGLYQVSSKNYEPVLATGDGRYVIQGDLLELRNGSLSSVTDQMLAAERSEALAQVKAEDMVIFPAAGNKPKRVVYVFTDVDCGYCRKFHAQMPDLNARGIEVRYLAFPRGGPSSPVAGKLAGVWCAKDRQRAMNDAKRGVQLAAATALCKHPVKSQYEVGSALGVRGTPAIFSQDGMHLGGYLPTDELAKTLQLR